MAKLRIRGLVRAERYVRGQLERRLSRTGVGKLREYVRSVVSDVEAICRRHNTVPGELPARSRNAFNFLRELEVPEPERSSEPAVPLDIPPRRSASVRVPNVVRMARTSLDSISKLLDDVGPDQVRSMVIPYLADSVRLVERGCAQRGGTPADLPTPSRNAYGIMAFLASDDQLDRYIEATRVLREALRGQERRTRWLVRMDNQGGVYRLRRRETALLTVSPGFIAAPEDVLSALVVCALHRNPAEDWDLVDRFVHADEFAAIRREIEAIKLGPGATKGAVYDLEEVCDHVRAQYFDPPIDRPASLVWSMQPTFRTFGQYSAVLDRITVSRSLDSAHVPRLVIDYVMYHELLHKLHGMPRGDSGRRAAHTAQFRTDEKLFPGREGAEQFMSRYSAQLRRVLAGR